MNAQGGFTALELLIVLAIVTLIVGAIALGVDALGIAG